jgi:hypothetical protein
LIELEEATAMNSNNSGNKAGGDGGQLESGDYDKKPFGVSAFFSSLSKSTKFVLLVGGIMFFFGCHNYMQELIMNLPGFKVRIQLLHHVLLSIK